MNSRPRSCSETFSYPASKDGKNDRLRWDDAESAETLFFYRCLSYARLMMNEQHKSLTYIRVAKSGLALSVRPLTFSPKLRATQILSTTGCVRSSVWYGKMASYGQKARACCLPKAQTSLQSPPALIDCTRRAISFGCDVMKQAPPTLVRVAIDSSGVLQELF